MRLQDRPGWTMAEMMVVVAIVLVLYSLTAAVIDRAVYDADLTACMANQRVIGLGAISYSADNRLHYPLRQGIGRDPETSPPTLADNSARQDSSQVLTIYDDRRILSAYIPITTALTCPLVKEVDLENTDRRTRVIASQALWFGWQYRHPDGKPERAINRVGDRFSWNGSLFNILVSDWTAFSREDSWAIGSHPDLYDGIMALQSFENSPQTYWLLQPATFSFWGTPDTAAPGPVDRTFLNTDCSASRLSRVFWRVNLAADKTMPASIDSAAQSWRRTDERMVRVPERAKEDPLRSTHLPKR